jgi:hypothetical protein
MGVYVNSNYDSGNIDVVNVSNPHDHVTHELELKVGLTGWLREGDGENLAGEREADAQGLQGLGARRAWGAQPRLPGQLGACRLSPPLMSTHTHMRHHPLLPPPPDPPGPLLRQGRAGAHAVVLFQGQQLRRRNAGLPHHQRRAGLVPPRLARLQRVRVLRQVRLAAAAAEQYRRRGGGGGGWASAGAAGY